MLSEKKKNHNRNLFEDYLRGNFQDRNQKHAVCVSCNDEVYFQEFIPVFVDLTHYEVWGEFQLMVMWEDSNVYDDKDEFHKDGLHGIYSSNFVFFEVNKSETMLMFRDGINRISVSI